MAKIAVFSDIHSNIHALELAMSSAEKKGATRFICLGDLVTKYFYPTEVVDAIKSQCDIVVKGNCDSLVATNENYKFARGKLGLNRIEYLDNLPTRQQMMIGGTLIDFFHASPESLDGMFNPFFSNEDTNYKDKCIYGINNLLVNSPALEELENRQISFCGHTHHEYIAVMESYGHTLINGTSFVSRPDQSLVVNVGSVGDSSKMIMTNGGASAFINDYLVYALIEGDLNSIEKSDIKVELVRVPYTETLKKVYFDMLNFQKGGLILPQKMDTARVEESLKKMGAKDIPSSEVELRRLK